MWDISSKACLKPTSQMLFSTSQSSVICRFFLYNWQEFMVLSYGTLRCRRLRRARCVAYDTSPPPCTRHLAAAVERPNWNIFLLFIPYTSFSGLSPPYTSSWRRPLPTPNLCSVLLLTWFGVLKREKICYFSCQRYFMKLVLMLTRFWKYGFGEDNFSSNNSR